MILKLLKRPSEKGWITSKRSHCIAFECLLKKACLRSQKWAVVVVYFFKESVVYPFVASEQKSGKHFISNEMIVKILSHVEDNRLSPI